MFTVLKLKIFPERAQIAKVAAVCEENYTWDSISTMGEPWVINPREEQAREATYFGISFANIGLPETLHHRPQIRLRRARKIMKGALDQVKADNCPSEMPDNMREKTALHMMRVSTLGIYT